MFRVQVFDIWFCSGLCLTYGCLEMSRLQFGICMVVGLRGLYLVGNGIGECFVLEMCFDGWSYLNGIMWSVQHKSGLLKKSKVFVYVFGNFWFYLVGKVSELESVFMLCVRVIFIWCDCVRLMFDVWCILLLLYTYIYIYLYSILYLILLYSSIPHSLLPFLYNSLPPLTILICLPFPFLPLFI